MVIGSVVCHFLNCLSQTHICRLEGDHLPGLECLSDGEVLPILIALDPDTLLSCGKANRRLHRLVCDREVWRSLLRGIESFTDARLQELVEFANLRVDGCSQEMMNEVAKEAVNRFRVCPLAFDGLYLLCAKEEEENRWKSSFEVRVSIQGWGAPVIFEMGGDVVEKGRREGHLEELCSVSDTIGAQFAIKEVKTSQQFQMHCRFDKIDPFKMISALFDWSGEEPGLDKLEMLSIELYSGCHDSFFSLLKASKSWEIQTLSTSGFHTSWAGLAKVAATGQIGTLEFDIVTFFVKIRPPSKEDVKAVWEIAEKFKAVIIDNDERVSRVQIEGGKGADPKMTWEDAYKTLLKQLC